MVHGTGSRTHTLLVAAILAFGMFWATGTLLATDGPGASKKRPVRRFKNKGRSASKNKGPQYSPRLIITTQHQWSVLQKAIKSKMKLTKEQTGKIDQIFADLNSALVSGHTPGPAFEPDAATPPAAKVPFPKTLHGTGDIARFRRRSALADARNARAGAVSPFASRRLVVEKLSPVFHGLQQNQFTKIAARWDVLLPMVGMRDGPLMRLRRSALDPELKLTESELEDVQNMIGARMMQFGADRFDQPKMIAAARELREKILAMLTPSQREKLIATNRALDKDAEVLRKKIAEAEAQASIPEKADDK